MNEPHDMGRADWHSTSNQVVRGLRGAGDQTWIWVAGDGWSKAHEWSQHNPSAPWIYDPLKRTAYEAHLYFDEDGSGRYQKTFEQELQVDPNLLLRGVERLEVFVQWCRRGKVPGVIGEFGVPWYGAAWLPVLDRFLVRAQQEQMTAIAWAGGDWWGDYPLSLQPRNDQEVGPLNAILRVAGQASLPGSLKAGDPASRRAGPGLFPGQ
jgi:endoglucanase